MNRFTKISDELIALGVRPRLAMLYGKLAFHARSGGCYAKHSTLAAEIGVKTPRHVRRLFQELQRLRLIEWDRGQYGNSYRTLPPDRTFLSYLKDRPDRTSASYPDRTKMSSQIGHFGPLQGSVSINEKNIEKKEDRPPDFPVRVNGQPERKPAAAGPKNWEAFTALYPPAKLNHAKAKIEWDRLMPHQELAAVAWLEKNRNCAQWLVEDGQFVPLASNFLKRREFESPPPPVIHRKGPQSAVERERDKYELTVAMAERYGKQKLGEKKP